ncbi:MAG: GNAT family N-acetyltransferase [Candidatus Marinimicrobia bacterium]|nr:GNAT family N-acetyltransferase [Candidatus Neomarinimicrobiota bacterium]
MEQLALGILEKSKTKVIAEILNGFNGFKIEFIEKIGSDDIAQLIEVSEELVKKFGDSAKLTKSNITKYFNKDTLPFVARQNSKIIGYIIGVPLEYFTKEAWSHYDINLGKDNTMYTYAFVVSEQFQGRGGYAKSLKRVYLNYVKKRNYKFITGHTELGIAKNFSKDTETVKIFPEWYNSRVSFEYYRRPIK